MGERARLACGFPAIAENHETFKPAAAFIRSQFRQQVGRAAC